MLIWALAALILFLDQLTKYLVSLGMEPGAPKEIIRNLFYLTLVHNTGAAFGIFKNQTATLVFITLITVAAIAIYIGKRARGYIMRDIGLSLILGGALGNLVDRLRFGYVVDFLDFRIWPVFNIADSTVSIGAFLVILSLFYNGGKAG